MSAASIHTFTLSAAVPFAEVCILKRTVRCSDRMVRCFYALKFRCTFPSRYLEKYTSSEVTMENGDKVLLAKQRYSALVKAYMRYIKEGRNV